MASRQFFLFSCLLLAFPFSAKADENLVELVKKVKPCVVLIETFDKDNKPLAQGSGFFINNKGHIVTNHHVLKGAYRATVKTSNGMEYPVEGIIAKNADADIVKLVVNIPDANTPFLNLSEIVPSEGQDIVVIGNPLGLESTVSAGIVSAVRDIPAFGKIIQITAPVSPGSSGSPVLNSNGEVIGIATLVVTKGQNLNFAIPSDKIIALKETAQTPIFNALSADSNNAQLFYQNGLKELWQENWSAALTLFQKTKEKNPRFAEAWFYIGYCYVELGRYQDAIESYKQTVRIEPDYADAHYNLGNAYGKLGRYQDEIESCKQAIRIKADFAEAYLNLGAAYGELGRYQDAIESFKQAIRIKPDLALAHNNLGRVYGKLGRYQDEIESYKQAIRINPDLAEAHYNLGLVYGKLSKYQDAIESFKQAIKIKPDLSEAHCNLGVSYGKLGLYQDEIESYKQAIRIKPDNAVARYNLGLAFVKLGLYQEAIESYKQAIRINPDYAVAHYNLGFAYFNLGRYQDVVESCKQAIRMKPDYAEAHHLLGLAYLMIGDKGSALEEYKILKILDAELANKLFNLIYK
ncbi:MAG: tetratricopeptide repeat protein [Sedimentisphaerales bacterium]